MATSTEAQTPRPIQMHRGKPVLPDNPSVAELQQFVQLSTSSKVGHAFAHHRFDRNGEAVRLRAMADRYIAQQQALDAPIASWEPIEDVILAALRAEYAGADVPWGHLNLAHQVAIAAHGTYEYAERRRREIADAESRRHTDHLVGDEDGAAAAIAHTLAEVQPA